ncbi:MAG: hypothetical protein ABI690_09890 [Chloroflexota bacterium]
MVEYTPHPDSKQSEKAYKTLERILLQRREQRAYLDQQTSDFADALFSALHQAVYECQERGLTELGEPRYLEHPAGGGRRALQIPIEDWNVIFVPLVGTAWPSIRDEAQIPGAAFKELCGRIAVFIGSESEATSFFDFLIFTNGSWFAWGFGWPKQAATIEDTDFQALSFELLSSFVKDIHMTWRPRSETELGTAMDARRRVFRFGLPGDE